jgi:hypothetical protein
MPKTPAVGIEELEVQASAFAENEDTPVTTPNIKPVTLDELEKRLLRNSIDNLATRVASLEKNFSSFAQTALDYLKFLVSKSEKKE